LLDASPLLSPGPNLVLDSYALVELMGGFAAGPWRR